MNEHFAEAGMAKILRYMGSMIIIFVDTDQKIE